MKHPSARYPFDADESSGSIPPAETDASCVRGNGGRAGSSLRPLDRSKPSVIFSRGGRSRRRKALFGAATFAACATVAGLAVLGNNNVLSAIGRSGQASGALDPNSAAMVERYNKNLAASHKPAARTPAGSLLPDTARIVRRLASGQRVYAIKTTASGLCVLVAGARIACGLPRSQSEPTTVEGMNETSKSGVSSLIALGITQHGTRAISFEADGQETTVAVVGNIWIFEGKSNARDRLTAYHTDGSVQVVEPTATSHARFRIVRRTPTTKQSKTG